MTGSAMGSSGTAAASPNRSTAATSSNRSARTGRGDVHLVSALCRYNQAMRTVNTRASNISGPNDQAFHNMIVNATNQLTQPTPVPSDRPAEPGQER
jgi:hypothetical protein